MTSQDIPTTAEIADRFAILTDDELADAYVGFRAAADAVDHVRRAGWTFNDAGGSYTRSGRIRYFAAFERVARDRGIVLPGQVYAA